MGGWYLNMLMMRCVYYSQTNDPPQSHRAHRGVTERFLGLVELSIFPRLPKRVSVRSQ